MSIFVYTNPRRATSRRLLTYYSRR